MIKSITSVKLSGRRVIIRAGFDVPLVKNVHTEKWEAADDTRIKDALSTLKYLIEQNAKIVLISHLDRPEGWNPDKSLLPAAEKLGELLKYKVVEVSDKLPDYKVGHINFLTSDITKKDYSALSKKLLPGSILFLENLRFYPGEQGNDKKFVTTLAKFGDVYVDEAFSDAHRKSASMFGLALELPSYAGISFLQEIKSLGQLLRHPQQPFVAIMGGIKVEDKVETIHNLAKHAQTILLGGGLASTFQKAIGYEVGQSKISDINLAKDLLRQYKQKIVLPIDVVVAGADGVSKLVKVDQVKSNESIYDIGPETVRKFAAHIKTAKTLVWNGPMGKFEDKKFAFGSRAIAHVFATRSHGAAFGIVGGGETAEVIDQAKVSEFIDHISTGGGAMLEFLAGKILPGIKVLEK